MNESLLYHKYICGVSHLKSLSYSQLNDFEGKGRWKLPLLCLWSGGAITSSATPTIPVFIVYLQQDSLFNLRRPYDLVALLKQEQRAIMLENLKEELLARKEEIDRNEDKDTGA